MSEYRWVLKPYQTPASKDTCPVCRKKRVFTRYIDTQTGELLPEHVGRCDRENNCGYHKTPKQFFEENKSFAPARNYKPQKAITDLPVDFINQELVLPSMCGYDNNAFVIYLKSLFGEHVAMDLVAKYCIGSSKHWKGSTIFWQLDRNENVRHCKIMLYDPATGKRIKAGATVQKWNASLKKFESLVTQDPCSKVYGKFLNSVTINLNLQQCFFGEHLLAEYPDNTVAIVESEKTAIIASVYFPKLVWIATGGSSGCGWSKTKISKVLKGRNVIMFPDLGQYESWKKKAETITGLIGCKVVVSDLLEKVATDEERKRGCDLADFLVKRDETGLAVTDGDYPVLWDFKNS
ncbi:MAG TPA: DUF6371 domain-containing protein [Chitinophagaceae bacterium]|jgi:hypothetical protein|nr:DUF6371 domain-containing protein [Chitinophagaceae bacterium]